MPLGCVGNSSCDPKQGGPPTTVYTGAPKELIVDATHVYWVESVGSESRVLKLPKPK